MKFLWRIYKVVYIRGAENMYASRIYNGKLFFEMAFFFSLGFFAFKALHIKGFTSFYFIRITFLARTQFFIYYSKLIRATIYLDRIFYFRLWRKKNAQSKDI